MLEFVYNSTRRRDGAQMTDHLHEAVRLIGPHEVEQPRFATRERDPLYPTPMLSPEPESAPVHAILAVASQLARIATALERLAGEQKGPSPQ
jgi:hypothetical protein